MATEVELRELEQYVADVLARRELEAKLPTSSIGAGWEAGKANWLGGLGALGAMLGIEGGQDLYNRMREEAEFYTRNAPGATSFRDVLEGGNFSDYLAYLAGSSAPFALEFAAGAGVGGLAGKAARRAAVEAAEAGTARLAAKEAAAKAAATRATLGGVAASYPSAVGDIAGTQYEETGEYSPAVAAALGVPYAALSAVGAEMPIIRALTRTGAARNAGWKGLASATGKGTLGAALGEGASETGQEALNLLGAKAIDDAVSLLDEEARERYMESFVGGATLGGVMGGASTPFSRTQQSIDAERAAAVATDNARIRDQEAKQAAALDQMLRPTPAATGALDRLAVLAEEEAGADATPQLGALQALAEQQAAAQVEQERARKATPDAALAAAQGMLNAELDTQEEVDLVLDRVAMYLAATPEEQAQILEQLSQRPGASAFITTPELERAARPDGGEGPAQRRPRDQATLALLEELASDGYSAVLPGFELYTTPPTPPAAPAAPAAPDTLDQAAQLLSQPGAEQRQATRDEAAMQRALAIDIRKKNIARLTQEAVERNPKATPAKVVQEVERRLGEPTTDEERTRILQGITALRTLPKAPIPERSTPNEMDAAALGIRERGAPRGAPAAPAAPVAEAPVAEAPVAETPRPDFTLYQGSKVPGKTVAAEKQAAEATARREKLNELLASANRAKAVGDTALARQLNEEVRRDYSANEIAEAATQDVAPGQGALFTQRGQPTEAATTTAAERKAKRSAAQPKEKQREEQAQAVRPDEAAEAQQEVTPEDAEAAEEAAMEAREAQAEADVDAGPIGQALQAIEDGSYTTVTGKVKDLDTKVNIEAFAKKLVADGVIEEDEDVREASSDRDNAPEDVLEVLRELVDNARDDAIAERVSELEAEAEEKANAVQEREAAAVDVREPARDSGAVGGGGEAVPAKAAQAKPRKAKAGAETQAGPVTQTLEERIASLEERIAEAEAEGKPTTQMQKRLDDLLIEQDKQRTGAGITAAQAPEEEVAGEVDTTVTDEVETPFGPATITYNNQDADFDMAPGEINPFHAKRIREILTDNTLDLHTKLDQIAALSTNRTIKMVMPFIKQFINDGDVRFSLVRSLPAEPNKPPPAAAYVANTRTIALTPQGLTQKTVLHELVHAATVRLIERATQLSNEKFKGDPPIDRDDKRFNDMTPEDARLVKAVIDLESIRNALNDGAYGFTSVAEMVAEVFSNAEFQRALQGAKPLPKLLTVGRLARHLNNVLGQLFNAIRGLFNASYAKDAPMANAFDQVLDLSSAFFASELGGNRIYGAAEDVRAPIPLSIKGVLESRTPTVAKLLRGIQQFSHVPAFAQLAERLSKMNLAYRVDYDPTQEYFSVTRLDGTPTLARGIHDFATSRIRIARSGATEATVLHEISHAATVARIAAAVDIIESKVPREKLTAEQAQLVFAYENIDQLRQFVENIGTLPKEYTRNVKEFVAYAMMDPDLQQALASIPLRNTPLSPSVFRQLLDFVHDLLGLTPQEATVFDAVTALSRTFEQKVDADGFVIPAPFMHTENKYANAMDPMEATLPQVAGALEAANDAVNPLRDKTYGVVGYGREGSQLHDAAGSPTESISVSRMGVATRKEGGVARRASGTALKANVAEGKRKFLAALEGLMHHVTTTQFRASVSRGFARVHALINEGQNITRSVRSYLDGRMRPVFAANEKYGTKLADMLSITTLRKMEDFKKNESEVYEAYMLRDITFRDVVDNIYHPLRDLADIGRFSFDEFMEGVALEGSKNIVKPFEGMTEDEAKSLYYAYESAMDAMGVGAAVLYHSKVDNTSRQRENMLYEVVNKSVKDRVVREKLTQFLLKAAEANERITFNKAKPAEGARTIVIDEEASAKVKELREQIRGIFSGKANDAEIDKVASLTGIPRAEVADIAATFSKENLQDYQVNSLRDYLKEFVDLSRTAIEARMYAIKSIAGGYVPLSRYGDFQISAEYYITETYRDDNGEVRTREVALRNDELSDTFRGLLPSIHSNHVENYLEPYAMEMDKQFANMGPVDVVLKNGEVVKGARMRMRSFQRGEGKNAETRHAFQVRGGTESTRIDYFQILELLSNIDHGPSAKMREDLIKQLTAADSTVRHNLMRSQHPGFDPDFVTSVSEHLNGTAAIVGKNAVSSEITDTLSNDYYWGVDQKLIDDAQAEYDKAKAGGNAAAIAVAQRKLAQTKRMFEGQQKDNSETSREQARELSSFYLDKLGYDLDDASFRKLRSVTAVTGLGLDFAKALTNLSSIPLHAFSALATYNASTGFGGGFGYSKASSALITAAKVIGPYMKIGLRRAFETTKDILEGKEGKPTTAEEFFRDAFQKASDAGGSYLGYPAEAWKFLLDETEQGGLKPQATNVLMGVAKKTAYGTKWDQFASRAMAMFSTTEEFNRMVTALASYTLFREQALAAGMPEIAAEPGQETVHTYAARQADAMVRFSQGDYSATNRPKLFRNGVGSLIFMYKTFAVTSLELLRMMPVEGRAMFLGSLWFMAGAQGIPLWEEMVAVFDAFAQKTGIGMGITKGNAEREFRKALKGIGDGLGIPLDEVVMHGLLDTMLGTNVFGRSGIQVGVPMIGAMRAGANFEQEMGKALGAPVGFISGAVSATGAVFKGDPHRFFKAVPISGVRNVYDSYAYAKYGVVMNKAGQRVMDADGVDVVARALGFYPQEFKEQNTIVRLEEYTRALSKEMTASFVENYRKAHISRDSAEKRQIVKDVQEHNEMFRGTALEIRNFTSRANRAAREAELSLTERLKKSLSKAQKAEADF